MADEGAGASADRFAVLGTTTVDVVLSGMDGIPRVGEDEFTPESYAFLDAPVRMMLGGNGANSAVALATLGARVTLCSTIGQDELGGLVRGWLEERGVSLAGLHVSREWATACTALALDRARHRLSLHHPGGSFRWTPGQIPPEPLQQAGVLLLNSYHLLKAFRPAGNRHVLRAAHQAGAVTALDIGPVVEPRLQWQELCGILPHLDYLFANRYELDACLGGRAGEPQAVLAGRRPGSALRALVVKEGGAGAVLYSPEGCVRAAGLPMPAHFEAQITVGAGDAFDAAFLFRLQRCGDAADSLRFANAAAALVVRSGQGTMGCPGLGQVEALLAST